MKMNKETTIAFAGSNTAELLSSTNDANLRNVISTEVYLLVAALYQQGFRTFLSGMLCKTLHNTPYVYKNIM